MEKCFLYFQLNINLIFHNPVIFVPQIKDLVKFKAKVLGEEYQGENYSGAIPFGNGLFKKPDSEK